MYTPLMLSAKEAYELINCADHEVESLLTRAGALRDRAKGRTITYSAKSSFLSRTCAAIDAHTAPSEKTQTIPMHGPCRRMKLPGFCHEVANRAAKKR